MTPSLYSGDRYLSLDEVERWCLEVAAAWPEFVTCKAIGTSLRGRPIYLLALSAAPKPEDCPAFWLDGGTHASEWTSVMAVLYSVSRWIEAWQAQDHDALAWFAKHTIYAVPCVSPDGYQAMFEGEPFLRSTLRPPLPGTLRVGFAPRDIDQDGAVRWMRWRHPAGSFVEDSEMPLCMRPRSLHDDPEDAFFFAQEGDFLHWDGVRWTAAPREFGIDLNRNFPAHWAPFHMFGMDGGTHPLSEPESRALTDALVARPHVAAAISHHTYTGAILTQPYRPDTPMPESDLRLMELIAEDAVEETDYRVFRVHPEFTYDPKQPIVGVWSDTLSTVFGIVGYTVELWDPYAHCGLQVKNPARFFRQPDINTIKTMLAHFAQTPNAVTPWRPFDHPQLGPVEIGGIDYLHTFRNPPVRLLAEECKKAHRIAECIKKVLPNIQFHVQVTPLSTHVTETSSAPQTSDASTLSRLQITIENLGFLSTTSLLRAQQLQLVPEISIQLQLPSTLELVSGESAQQLGHLDGWGDSIVGWGRHPIYPALPKRGHRVHAEWLLRGHGELTLQWTAGRGGRGALQVIL